MKPIPKPMVELSDGKRLHHPKGTPYESGHFVGQRQLARCGMVGKPVWVITETDPRPTCRTCQALSPT